MTPSPLHQLEELPARSERPSHFLTGPVQVTASVWRQDGPDGPDWFRECPRHGVFGPYSARGMDETNVPVCFVCSVLRSRTAVEARARRVAWVSVGVISHE